MREMMRSRDRRILGVAGGIAEYMDMDKTVWRAIWVFGSIVMPPVILAYLILGMVMPPAPAPVYQAPPFGWEPPGAPPFEPQTEPQSGPWTRSEGESQPNFGEPVHTRRAYRPLTKSSDKWLAGVAGGVAEYFDVDPVLVRALWLASIFLAGSGLLLYIVLAILMPQPPARYRHP